MLRTASLSSCSPILISVSVMDVCWRHLLEGRGDVLITAVDELAAGDVIRDLLRLPKLPGQRPLPSCHHLKGEYLWVLPLSRMVVGQVLGH